MTLEELASLTKTPFDCPCEGHGVVLSTQDRCAEHFLYSTSEDYRLEALRLCYQNLRAFTVFHTEALKEIAPHLPQKGAKVDQIVEAIYNPKTPEEWLKALQNYILTVISYYLCD